jgi:hypothetical protein
MVITIALLDFDTYGTGKSKKLLKKNLNTRQITLY